MKFTSRKFLLSMIGTINFVVLTVVSFFYRPELTIGLAGVMAGIITAYLAVNITQDYIYKNGR